MTYFQCQWWTCRFTVHMRGLVQLLSRIALIRTRLAGLGLGFVATSKHSALPNGDLSVRWQQPAAVFAVVESMLLSVAKLLVIPLI
jgi:hypothetical protein